MSRNPITRLWHPSLGLVLWFSMSAGAHVGDRVYPIAWLSDEMLEEIRLDDGSVDEWEELVGNPAMTLLDFREELEGSIPDPADLDLRIWLAWHDDPPRFYVACVASDDVYKNNHDYHVTDFSGRHLIQRHDSIVLGIDGDHSGGNSASGMKLEGWEELSGKTQYYEAIAYTPDGPTLDEPGIRHQTGEFAWNALPPYGEGGQVSRRVAASLPPYRTGRLRGRVGLMGPDQGRSGNRLRRRTRHACHPVFF